MNVELAGTEVTEQVGAKEFVFFDPNYGAFHFSKDKLANCFQHLFWTPAITVDKSVRDHDKAVYLRRDEGVEKEAVICSIVSF